MIKDDPTAQLELWNKTMNILSEHPEYAKGGLAQAHDAHRRRGSPPLHIALKSGAPFELIQALISAHPQGCNQNSILIQAIEWKKENTTEKNSHRKRKFD